MKKTVCGITAVCLFLAAAPVQAEGGNPLEVRQTVDYILRDSVDIRGNKYLFLAGEHPPLQTFVNPDGTVSVCAADDRGNTTYVYEYSEDLALRRTLAFKNELAILGAFTKDGDGNYYFFYAETVAEGAFSANNMALVKYAPGGEKTGAFFLPAQTRDEKWAPGFSGVKVPFDAGTCRLEISGDLIAVYFAREMFKARDGRNHQASYGFILNKDNLERLPDVTMPSAGHSLNQFILPIAEGFLFADHGDAGPRAFNFARVQPGVKMKEAQSFRFNGARGQNGTFAEMGGLAKTSAGYIFAGTYGGARDKSRNLFILTFDDAMSACGKPVYITGYKPAEGHAAHPKITAIGGGRYLILWERCAISNQSPQQIPSSWERTPWLSTCMLIIDEKGTPVSGVTELPGVRLSMNDTLRYNPVNGKVYWAVTGPHPSGNGKQDIVVYALDPEGFASAAAESLETGAVE
jgi:hypothetical protein